MRDQTRARRVPVWVAGSFCEGFAARSSRLRRVEGEAMRISVEGRRLTDQDRATTAVVGGSQPSIRSTCPASAGRTGLPATSRAEGTKEAVPGRTTRTRTNWAGGTHRTSVNRSSRGCQSVLRVLQARTASLSRPVRLLAVHRSRVLRRASSPPVVAVPVRTPSSPS